MAPKPSSRIYTAIGMRWSKLDITVVGSADFAHVARARHNASSKSAWRPNSYRSQELLMILKVAVR